MSDISMRQKKVERTIIQEAVTLMLCHNNLVFVNAMELP